MDQQFYKYFCSSAKDVLKEMSGIDIVGLDSLEEESGEIHSMGISSIITFAGAKKGRLLIDMEPELALHATNIILGEDYKDSKERTVLSLVAEINNIVSGNAITKINNRHLTDLRLAPPIVFAGRDVVITIPKLDSISSWGQTDRGKIRINIAWEGGIS